MFKALEQLSDRLLSKLVPNTTAAASCPCGTYPYTGPCWWTVNCGSQQNYKHKDCYCEQSGAVVWCTTCHY